MLTLILLIITLLPSTSPTCVMRGIGEESPNNIYEQEPVTLEGEGLDLLGYMCPSIVTRTVLREKSIKTCCDIEQLRVFKESASILNGLVGHCSICQENILRLTCHILCHPDQKSFSYVTISNSSILKWFLGIHIEFATGIFNSCKDVKIKNSIIPLTSFLCTPEHGECTPADFVASLLSHSAILMIPKFNHSSYGKNQFKDLLRPEAALCSKSYSYPSKYLPACRCHDCEASCAPIIVPPDENTKSKALTNYQIVIITIGTVVIVLYLIFGGLSLLGGKYGNKIEIWTFNRSKDSSNLQNDGIRHRIFVFFETFGRNSQERMRGFYRWWGRLVASNKFVFTLLPLAVICVLCFGIAYRFETVSEPIDIWSPPNSKYRHQKEFFDSNLGPFYRTAQILITAPKKNSSVHDIYGKPVNFGPVLEDNVILELFDMQKDIENLYVEIENHKDSQAPQMQNITLEDICIKPSEPYNNKCAFFSITQYFQNEISNTHIIDSRPNVWRSHLYYCSKSYGSQDDKLNQISCISEFLAPIRPNLVYGGYHGDNPLEADTLITTYIIHNFNDTSKQANILKWEAKLLEYLHNYKSPTIEISYSTERSLHDELEKQSSAQIPTIVFSYLVMFLYVTFTLGRFSSCKISTILVEQKLMIGFVGVILVLVSVCSSIGFFCYIGYKVNMIVLEVLPFITLAIGIDNIFLMVHELERIQRKESSPMSVPELIGEMMGNVGIGMLVSAVSQVVTFSIAALSNIPAVKSFSLFAAVALGINFLVQMTAFLSILSLDVMRERSRRINLLCCVKVSSFHPMSSTPLLEISFSYIAKVTLSPIGRIFIVSSFLLVWTVSFFYLPSVSIALDQTIALPKDSYLHNYLHDIFNKLKTGPPVYFIIDPEYRYENISNRLPICSLNECHPQSMTAIIDYYARMPNYTKIATAADSWVDTYTLWLQSSGHSTCCYYRLGGNNTKEFCPAYKKNRTNCHPCFNHTEESTVNVTAQEFIDFLPWFLSDIPIEACPYGGKPSYSKNVILDSRYYDDKDMTVNPVKTSGFMAYHTVMSNSEDMITAMTKSIELTKNLSLTLNHTVWPYSVFYIYYDFYFTIWNEIYLAFGLAFLATFLVNLLLFGFDFRMGTIMTLLTFVIDVVNVAFMSGLNISLNPISFVNLIMFIGINIEFLSHIGRAYISCAEFSRLEKAKIAMIRTGSSVFSGITMTKLLGIVVLAFSKSELFQVYYFQMYACAVLVGTMHGIVLLPVVLSYIGPHSKIILPISESK